jgi:hypothetical protein
VGGLAHSQLVASGEAVGIIAILVNQAQLINYANVHTSRMDLTTCHTPTQNSLQVPFVVQIHLQSSVVGVLVNVLANTASVPGDIQRCGCRRELQGGTLTRFWQSTSDLTCCVRHADLSVRIDPLHTEQGVQMTGGLTCVHVACRTIRK